MKKRLLIIVNRLLQGGIDTILIEYLKKFGYSGEQAVSILGTAPVEGHISGIVDIPNACATLWIPTEIFEFDIRPNADGPKIMVPPGVDVSFTS